MESLNLAKTYDPTQVEDKWYAFWQERGYFRLPPKRERPDAEAFCITIPPPNVTGSLHIGHALQHSIHDCIARWRRMQGRRVLVVPGTDHAAISTNMKVEQLLAEEGISRHDLGREEFINRCWEWTRKYGGQIIEQLKALGCSYDWDRLRFTLDENYYHAVQLAFVHFHQRGWLYRGHRVVNWCPECNSTVSDLEVQHVDRQGKLWHIRYPLAGSDDYLVVATTRPETMLGDTAVAVHSQDPRYTKYHGKTVILPLLQRELRVICDDLLVDPSVGTGAVKVTPAHDPNDFESGERNNLPAIIVIGPDAHMTAEAAQYAGLDRYEARERIIEDLEKQGLLEKIEDYQYTIGCHDRCQTVLEPLLSEQWFLQMKELANLALRVIEGPAPKISYFPDRFRGYTIEWLQNIRDWNISRQIWWGHRIPAYFCLECDHLMVQLPSPENCEKCGGPIRQDEDTLDTWFSSALWPFVVLDWPNLDEFNRSRAENVYPTHLMITARDILYLWIVRMTMTSLEFASDIPFEEVLVHPTVLDLEGRRMSKSLGTGLDPLELIADYGSDATRFSLLYQCASDQDIRFGAERTEMARNFCNKIWNASRFVLMNLGEDFTPAADLPAEILRTGTLAERWILSRYQKMIETVTDNLNRYEMAETARSLHSFVWSEFCDWFVEISKPVLRNNDPSALRAKQTLWFILEGILRALHPFMPYITEEIWQQLPMTGEALIVAPWPTCDKAWINDKAEQEFAVIMEIVVASRKLRADQKVPTADRVAINIALSSPRLTQLLEENKTSILLLARGSGLVLNDASVEYPPLAEIRHILGETIAVWIKRELTTEELIKQRQRLTRDIERLRGDEESLSKKLNNPQFKEKAPPQVILQAEQRYAEIKDKIAALGSQLADLTRSLEGRTPS